MRSSVEVITLFLLVCVGRRYVYEIGGESGIYLDRVMGLCW